MGGCTVRFDLAHAAVYNTMHTLLVFILSEIVFEILVVVAFF